MTPQRPRPAAVPVVLPLAAPPPGWQPSRYGEEKRPNLVAIVGSLVIVGGLVSSLMALNVVGNQQARETLTVVDMLSPPEPPAPPPPPPQQPQPDPVQTRQPSPVVVLPPPIVLAPAPSPITTSPEPPPPQVTVPGPPAPPQPAPARAPAIESVGDLSSRMIQATPPSYPRESRRRREEGTVVLMVLLGEDGKVADISVSQSSGFDRLDRAALAAVRRWVWSPTIRAGAPVMVRGMVEIPFILQS